MGSTLRFLLLPFRSADFMGGSCHRGLRRSAETLLEDARDDLLRHLEQHKGYRLVLCGHSLGGGALWLYLSPL